MNRYVYHYCAQYQKNAGEVTHADGLFRTEKRIITLIHLDELRESIEPEYKGPINISSLSFLGMEDD